MGKGTKHARDWNETPLQVLIDARNLYIHSVRIMGNPKHFNPADDFDTSFECVMACIRKGNSGRLVRNMIQFSSILKQKGDHPDGTRHQRTEAA